MKKILFISQYFYPEVFRGNDIADHLVKKGYGVHVIAGTPNYPVGKFYRGYGWIKRRKEIVKGVHVTRLPIIPRGNNKIMLMLNYFSFFIISSVYVVFHALFNKYDCVFVQQLSPIMMSTPGILYKKLRKVPLYTWVLDLWPESLTAAGGIKNKYVLSFFDFFVKLEYKHSDKILISSRSFTDSILKYGDYSGKVVYYPQWADGVDDVDNKTILPALPDGFKLLFAGAVGEAHGFECTMQAALLTKNYKDIKWIIVGDGRKLDWVKKFVKDNRLEDTVLSLGRYPSNTMPRFFEQADVMLVTLRDEPLFKLYAPAKISSYMASARPIIAVLNGEGGELIKEAECGWHIQAGDADSLARLVVELSRVEKSLLYQKGVNGKKYYEKFFTKEKCLNKLMHIMDL